MPQMKKKKLKVNFHFKNDFVAFDDVWQWAGCFKYELSPCKTISFLVIFHQNFSHLLKILFPKPPELRISLRFFYAPLYGPFADRLPVLAIYLVLSTFSPIPLPLLPLITARTYWNISVVICLPLSEANWWEKFVKWWIIE